MRNLWVFRGVLFLSLLIMAPSTIHAERLITAPSPSIIDITPDFKGLSLVVFGAIERDRITVDRAESYNVIMSLRGTSEDNLLWKKERFFGIWINRKSVLYENVPSFYTLYSTAPLSSFARDPILDKYAIGLTHLPFLNSGTPQSEKNVAFETAFLRLKHEEHLFSQYPGAIDFLGDMVFKANITLPANIPVGTYTLKTYLFRGNALLAIEEDTLLVRKVGFERFIFDIAHQHAFLYGVATLLIAISTGWLAGVIFRRD